MRIPMQSSFAYMKKSWTRIANFTLMQLTAVIIAKEEKMYFSESIVHHFNINRIKYQTGLGYVDFKIKILKKFSESYI